MIDDKNQALIEEMYQKRVEEEKPATDLERNIIRKEVTAKVMNLPKEGGIETLYKRELEVREFSSRS